MVAGNRSRLGRVRCAIVAVYVFAVVILVPNYSSLVVRRSATTAADLNGNSHSPQ